MTSIWYLGMISLIFQLGLMAQDTNLNQWDRDFVKLTTGARENVQFSLYRKEGEKDFVYIELVNRRNCDVKVNFDLLESIPSVDGKPISMVAYISANSVWANGEERKVRCSIWNPTVTIRMVTEGFLTESEEIETDSTGKVTTRKAVQFKTNAENQLRREQSRDK
jgi:hypothetical protein